MKPLPQSHPFHTPTSRAFRQWSEGIEMGAGYGQRETHFPNDAAYAVGVYDYDQERWTHIKVMVGNEDWRLIEL